MHHADHFADVLSCGVLLGVDSKLFVRLGRDVDAGEVLLLTSDRQQQPTALFRVFVLHIVAEGLLLGGVSGALAGVRIDAVLSEQLVEVVSEALRDDRFGWIEPVVPELLYLERQRVNPTEAR